MFKFKDSSLDEFKVLSDCFYVENFLQKNMKIDSEKMMDDLNSLPVWSVKKEGDKYSGEGNWILPEYPFMGYRGLKLNRFKCFFWNGDKGIPKYYYTGFQKASMFAYQKAETCPIINDIMSLFTKNLVWKDKTFNFNQTIVTKYRNWKDNIGAHQDKPKDIAENSPIFIITLCKPGNERVMVLSKGKEVIWKKKLANGSLLVLGDKANGTYKGGKGQEEVKHEILKGEDEKIGERISLVVRDIRTFIKPEKIYKDFVKHVDTMEKRIKEKTGKDVKYEDKKMLEAWQRK